MITQIKGKLIEKNPTQVVVDCNGIGYEINISLYTFSSLSSNENIKLFTHLQVREDAHILYGFFTMDSESHYNWWKFKGLFRNCLKLLEHSKNNL